MTANAPKAGPRSSLLKAAAQFSLGSALGLAGNILRAGMAARMFPPDVAGTWLGLQLVYNYGVNLHFGALFGMFRSVPVARAQGDDARAEEVKATTLTFLLAVCGVGALALVVAFFSMPPSATRRYLFATGALTLVTLLKSYYVTLFKAESRFREVSISAAVGSVVSFLTLGLIWVAGLDGLIWGMFAQFSTEVALLVRYLGPPKLGWRWPVLRAQLAVGLQTLVVSVVTTTLTTVDRTVMLQRLGATKTGAYYLGATLVVLLPALAGLPFTVLTPRFFDRAGRGESLVNLVEVPVKVGGLVFSVVLGAGALALPAVVTRLWPQLAAGNPASTVALAGTLPLVLAGLTTNVFYALDRQVVQLLLLGASAALGYGVATAAVILHPSLTSAAAGSAVGLFAYYVSTVFAAYWLMKQSWRQAARLVLESLAPGALVIALVVALRLGGGLVWPDASIVRAALSIVVLFGLAAVPVRRSVQALRAL